MNVHIRNFLLDEYETDASEVRARAFRCVEIWKDYELVLYLTISLMPLSPDVRATARRLLAVLGADDMLLVLRDQMTSAILGSCEAGANGEFDAPCALVSNIRDLIHGSCDLKLSAGLALGELRDSRAIPALTFALGDAEANVRQVAIDSLGKLGDDSAVGTLTRLLENHWDDQAKVHAVRALWRFHCRCAVVPLIRALKSDHPEVRRIAALRLGSFDDNRAVRPLVEALYDWDNGRGVVLAVLFSLENLCDERSIPHLSKYIANPVCRSVLMRETAKRVLAGIERRTSMIDVPHWWDQPFLGVQRCSFPSLLQVRDV